MATGIPYRRLEDSLRAFPWRPFILVLGTDRYVLPAMDTHSLLIALRTLPAGRYQSAGRIAETVARGLAKGWPASFSEQDEPILLRAIEGVRARRPLPTGLRSLREALLRRIDLDPAGA